MESESILSSIPRRDIEHLQDLPQLLTSQNDFEDTALGSFSFLDPDTYPIPKPQSSSRFVSQIRHPQPPFYPLNTTETPRRPSDALSDQNPAWHRSYSHPDFSILRSSTPIQGSQRRLSRSTSDSPSGDSIYVKRDSSEWGSSPISRKASSDIELGEYDGEEGYNVGWDGTWTRWEDDELDLSALRFGTNVRRVAPSRQHR